MRVAIYENDTVAVYRDGRIADFVNPVTGEVITKEQIAASYLAKAQADCPDARCVIEFFHPDGSGFHEDTWPDTTPVAGAVAEHELSVEQTAETGV